ncbi:Cullin repeat-like-containing domain superfamily [Babesia duncani]|uniref:Cullin repeat-like-containing domain superfamily n=1 Tax=Babesia duncani TaxID=323732 RepID=A0AAD9UP59_9APIC|nr:Cullin repeat-like-containing domain superfamily [Babesia duncani]
MPCQVLIVSRILQVCVCLLVIFSSLIHEACSNPRTQHCHVLYNQLTSHFVYYIDQKVSICCMLYISKVNVPLKSTPDKSDFLLESWDRYNRYLGYVSRLFSYIDRFYVPLVSESTIREFGLGLFCREVCVYIDIIWHAGC